MKVIILAAGRGSRMKALTEDRPKCLVELNGRSLLSRQVEALRGGGIGEIGIVTGYRAESFAPFGFHTFHNARWAETNMVQSLCAAAEWLAAEPCLVSYADIFYPAVTVRRLAGSAAELAIAYDPAWLAQWSARFADPLSDAETFALDGNGNLAEIGARPTSLDQVQGQYMGLLKFRPAGWARIAAMLDALPPGRRDTLDMTGLLRLLLADGAAIAAVPTEPEPNGWGEVDSETDLAHFAALLADAPQTKN